MKKNISHTHPLTAVIAIIIAGISLLFLYRFITTLHRLDNQTLNTDTSLTVADGDYINIDFIGTADGVELKGGNTKGKGEKLLIGSGSYLDGFEEQLIGHHVGETLEVVITFPQDYVDEELRNKEAVYVTTINGIYQ